MNMLEVGDKAPQFEVKDQDGNVVSSANLKGKKWIVFFYPKASTPGCTMEACSLRDHFKELANLGYAIFGVSADSEKRQANFKQKFKLPFPLLADENHDVLNGFGAWGPKKFMGRTFDGIHRTTFAINEQGVITHVVKKVKTKNHGEQLLELL